MNNRAINTIGHRIFPGMTWRIDTGEPRIFLTFDDGPCPETTPFILETLQKFNAKATFFCLGKNVVNHPDLYQMIPDQGHLTGNHSFSHYNGWKTRTYDYVRDVLKARKHIRSELFRPPYGKIRPLQIRELKKRFEIIMWDVLSRDYDRDITPEKCSRIVIKNVRSGSVIVFHDSLKAKKNMEYALVRSLEYFEKKGIACVTL